MSVYNKCFLLLDLLAVCNSSAFVDPPNLFLFEPSTQPASLGNPGYSTKFSRDSSVITRMLVCVHPKKTECEWQTISLATC